MNYKNEENIKNYNIVMRKLKNKENPNSVNKLVNQKFIDKIEELKIEEDNKNKINEEDKSNKEKKLNYISPFPVPGYELHENLWDLVCDLNEKELEKIEEIIEYIQNYIVTIKTDKDSDKEFLTEIEKYFNNTINLIKERKNNETSKEIYKLIVINSDNEG